MQLDYTLTATDLSEAAASLNPHARKGLALGDVGGYLLWFALTTWNAATGIPFSTAGRLANAPATRNLWIDISPSLCIATYILTNYLVQPTVQRLKAKGERRSREWAAAVHSLSALCVVWLLPIAWSWPVVSWHPTEGREVCAAIAPWMLYLAIVRFVAVRRTLGAIRHQWEGSESLQRPNITTVNQEGVFCGDGVIEYRIHWRGFKRYYETENLLLLAIDSGLVIFIPKRSVGDLAQMSELKMLIQNNIANGEFTITPAGFPVITAPVQVY
jgi:YcxB-like protein